MRIPLNVIHWYIGWPIILAIALWSFSIRKNTPNSINTLFGLCAWIFVFCLACYGLPPLLTLDSRILTFTTIVADGLQFIALFFMWLAVARIYFPGNRAASNTLGGLSLAMACAGIAVSISANMAHPVSMVMVNGSWQLDFAFPLGYQIVTGFQYASLLFLSAKLWVQARPLNSTIQRLRLRSFALAFLFIGGFYVLRPFFNFTSSGGVLAQNILLITGIVIFGGFAAATFYLGRLQTKSTK